MPAEVLTELRIKGLKPKGETQWELYDRSVSGLGLRVSRGGTKTFFLWYRFGRRAKRLTLGRYPDISLAEARSAAREARRSIALGTDPAAKKWETAARRDHVFADLVTDFIENYARRKTSSWRETERLLVREFVGLWRIRPIGAVTKQDVNEALDAIVNRGSPSAANHAFAALRKLFNWAVERGYIQSSPCAGSRSPSAFVKRDRTLTETELAKIWDAARRFSYPYGAVVELLILTGQRRDEVSQMRWCDLDLDSMLWILPSDRTKSRRAHAVPLCPLAKATIAALPKLHPTLVFPARGKETAISGFSKWKRAIDECAGVTGWRLHDIRRTVATGLAGLGTPPHVIERLLNHSTGTFGGVTGIYIRFDYLPEIRKGLLAWEEHLAALPDTVIAGRKK